MLKRRKRSTQRLLRRKGPSLKRRKEIDLFAYPPHWYKIVGDSDICYVCDAKIKSHHIRKYLGVHPIYDMKIYSHERCHALSDVWHKKFGSNEQFREEYSKWKKEKKDAEGK